MIVTILTLSSFCLPHCYPGFSSFHSLRENNHLASNHCHSSLVDSQIAILFYSTSFLVSCPNSQVFLSIVNHDPPAVITTSPVSKSVSIAFWFSFLSSFFFSFLLITSQFFSVFLSYIDEHTHTYEFKLALPNPTSSKTLFLSSFLPSHLFQLNFKHYLFP